MARVKLMLSGFESMLEKIQTAGGNVNQAAERCLRESAQIMEDELRNEMQSSGVDGGLISRLPPPEITSSGNVISAKVGYKMDGYNPSNPSDGFKVAFLNYGTVNRKAKDDKQRIKIGGEWVTVDTSRGAIAEHGFIARAKSKAAPKIKKRQRETLNEILGGMSE